MKKNIINEIRNKTLSELEKEIQKANEELVKLRIDFKTGKLKNTTSLRVQSDKLAILKTIKREKEIIGGLKQ